MGGAEKVFNTKRQKEVLKNAYRPDKVFKMGVEDAGKLFTPDTSEQDRIAQETLDLMKAEAEKPAVPLPDEYELRRAARRRGGARGAGRKSTILTDRLGG